MICNCGGLTRSHETKAGYVHTCNACGRRHVIEKQKPLTVTPEQRIISLSIKERDDEQPI